MMFEGQKPSQSLVSVAAVGPIVQHRIAPHKSRFIFGVRVSSLLLMAHTLSSRRRYGTWCWHSLLSEVFQGLQ